MNGRPLVWLDNAATTQKPKAVIDRLTYFYEHENSNIHRAAHELAARVDGCLRGRAQQGGALPQRADRPRRSCSCAAPPRPSTSWRRRSGRQHVGAGDEIVITHLEHHANIVPWQQLALAKGAKLRVAPVDDRGSGAARRSTASCSTARPSSSAFTQVSNALGTVTPAKADDRDGDSASARRCAARRRAVGLAHAAWTCRISARTSSCSPGTSVFAPTGIGVLWGRKDLLDSLPP